MTDEGMTELRRVYPWAAGEIERLRAAVDGAIEVNNAQLLENDRLRADNASLVAEVRRLAALAGTAETGEASPCDHVPLAVTEGTKCWRCGAWLDGPVVPASVAQCTRPERSEVNAPAIGSHVTSPATQGDGSGDRRDGGPGAPHGWRACNGCAKPFECLMAGCANALLGSQPPARCHCGAFHIDGTSCEVTT